MARVLHRVGWIGLTVVGAFLLFGVTADLTGDHRTGIPTDHAATFTALAGHTFASTTQATPGVARYITTLEVGYALHEATFALLFVALVVCGVRRRQLWTWWSCWAVMIADVGYTVTFGRHDPTILARSLVAVIAVPVFLALCAPLVLRHTASSSLDGSVPVKTPGAATI